MRVIETLDFEPLPPSACALGMFDGVHIGHQAVLSACLAQARERQLMPVVFSFQNHPQHALSPTPLPLLSALPDRLAAFEAMGFDVALVPPFSPALMQMPASVYAEAMLARQINAKAVVTGYDYHFGLHRQGDVALLAALGPRLGFAVTTMAPVKAHFAGGEQIISSTQIRKLLQYGDVEAAAALLGRPYALPGTLVKGDGRGHKLGFATANMAPAENRLVPAVGVYACWLQIAEQTFPAACNIGFNPTVLQGDARPSSPRIETHALLSAGEAWPEQAVLGTPFQIKFVARLRSEQRFETLADLVRQIGQDCDLARVKLAQLNVI